MPWVQLCCPALRDCQHCALLHAVRLPNTVRFSMLCDCQTVCASPCRTFLLLQVRAREREQLDAAAVLSYTACLCPFVALLQVRAREREQLEHEEGYLQMGDAALKLMKE